MSRIGPFVVAACGLGVMIAWFYSLGAEVIFIENEGIPMDINPWPLRISLALGVVLFIGGLVTGLANLSPPRKR